jgi:formate-dependent nitrite reductase membrane component NrfD
MNPFVYDPEWGWWIVSYFFLGGLAAGAYFSATLIDLATIREPSAASSPTAGLSRLGYTVALPLILVCGVLLTLDLGQPTRFWHMLLKSERVKEALSDGWPFGGWRAMSHALIFKRWSPMSVGSWALTLFGFCSALSLLGAWRPQGRWTRWLHRGAAARTVQVVGCLAGFFVAAYTGTLLSASNQSPWSDTCWLAPLFLTSAASTGVSLLLLLSRADGGVPAEAREQLERADLWVLGLELLVFAGFLVSAGSLLGLVWTTVNGKLLIAGVLTLGVVLPIVLHLGARWLGNATAGSGPIVLASLFALAGSFLLRYSILYTPPEMRQRPEALRKAAEPTTVGTPAPPLSGVLTISPEDGREDGGGPGADPGNYVPGLLPRSKLSPGEPPRERQSSQ